MLLGSDDTDNLTLNGSIQGTNALSFEGATDGDGFQTTLAITDPTTADRTITIPDADGTVVLTGATLSNNIAVTTDGSGQLVNALDAQVFTVESNDINIGDDNSDDIDFVGQVDFADNVDANNGLDVTGAALTTDQAITQTGTNQVTFGGNVNADLGLDVTGAALTTDQAITQTGTDQVTFGGNVNADLGLDVTGAALTTDQAITQTGTDQVTFGGNVDADNGLDVTGAYRRMMPCC